MVTSISVAEDKPFSVHGQWHKLNNVLSRGNYDTVNFYKCILIIWSRMYYYPNSKATIFFSSNVNKKIIIVLVLVIMIILLQPYLYDSILKLLVCLVKIFLEQWTVKV